MPKFPLGRGTREYVSTPHAPGPFEAGGSLAESSGPTIDLQQRRDQLAERMSELQWDLGGLTYEMVIRNRVRIDVLVRRAAMLQEVEAELAEVERILWTEQTGASGVCRHCNAPHSTGAAYCWQCGQPLLQQVAGETIAAPQGFS